MTQDLISWPPHSSPFELVPKGPWLRTVTLIAGVMLKVPHELGGQRPRVRGHEIF